MNGNRQNIQNRITKIFGKAPSACTLVRPFVLEVEFADNTDLSQPMDYEDFSNDSATIVSTGLKELIDDYPLIIFRNAHIEDPYDSSMAVTGSMIGKAPFMDQDMFHRDFIIPDDATSLFATLLLDPKKLGREAPTYYALRSSVIRAAQLLNRSNNFSLARGGKPATQEAKNYFKKLTEGTLKFEFQAYKENDQRYAFNAEANIETTKRLFDEIPEEEKYAVKWDKGQSIIVLHSNIDQDLLHARPTSQDRHQTVESIDLALGKLEV